MISPHASPPKTRLARKHKLSQPQKAAAFPPLCVLRPKALSLRRRASTRCVKQRSTGAKLLNMKNPAHTPDTRTSAHTWTSAHPNQRATLPVCQSAQAGSMLGWIEQFHVLLRTNLTSSRHLATAQCTGWSHVRVCVCMSGNRGAAATPFTFDNTMG